MKPKLARVGEHGIDQLNFRQASRLMKGEKAICLLEAKRVTFDQDKDTENLYEYNV